MVMFLGAVIITLWDPHWVCYVMFAMSFAILCLLGDMGERGMEAYDPIRFNKTLLTLSIAPGVFLVLGLMFHIPHWLSERSKLSSAVAELPMVAPVEAVQEGSQWKIGRSLLCLMFGCVEVGSVGTLLLLQRFTINNQGPVFPLQWDQFIPTVCVFVIVVGCIFLMLVLAGLALWEVGGWLKGRILGTTT